MGSGRDKRKKAKGHVPGQGAEKTAKKTEKNEGKAQRRTEKQAVGTDDDIDALLASFKLQDAAVATVRIEEDCPPPSPRICCSFIPLLLQKETEIAMLGGEYFDSDADKQHVYGDLYLYNCDRNSWRKVVIPHSPPPRNAHQAVAYRKHMFVFGGEVCSPSGQNFKHYRDLWRLDTESWSWESLPCRGGPSARSGHRMALYKGSIVLFGGFYDATEGCRYFNDLWLFSIEQLKWEQVAQPGVAPAPRGGCQLLVSGDTLYLFGGHSVTTETDGTETETVFDDMWRLDLRSYQWERLKKAGMAPGPRASFGMTAHKKRAVLFGGITDQKGKADKVFSEAHDDLYQFSLESHRWFPLALRKPKALKAEAAPAVSAAHGASSTAADCAKAAAGAGTSGSGDMAGGTAQGGVLRPDLPGAMQRAGVDKHSALYRAVVRIQSRYRGYVIRKAYTTYKLGGKLSEMLYSPATYGVDFSGKHLPRPKARANPNMAVVGNHLWLMGGIVEISLTDVTLDDIWRLDLNKLDGWACVKENTAGEDAFKDSEHSDDDDEKLEDADSDA